MSRLIQLRVRQRERQRDTLYFETFDRGTDDETRVGLRFRFSAYDNRWYHWLVDNNGSVFAGPMRLVPGVDLWRPFKYDPRVPRGQLFVFSQGGSPPTKDTVDNEAKLYYRPAAEVAS